MRTERVAPAYTAAQGEGTGMDGREPKEDVRGGAEEHSQQQEEQEEQEDEVEDAEEEEVEARLGWTRKFKT